MTISQLSQPCYCGVMPCMRRAAAPRLVSAMAVRSTVAGSWFNAMSCLALTRSWTLYSLLHSLWGQGQQQQQQRQNLGDFEQQSQQAGLPQGRKSFGKTSRCVKQVARTHHDIAGVEVSRAELDCLLQIESFDSVYLLLADQSAMQRRLWQHEQLRCAPLHTQLLHKQSQSVSSNCRARSADLAHLACWTW